MEKVAILGGEGSGKTVLLTVLSQSYRRRSDGGFLLEQCSPETAQFTNTNWRRLTEDQDWPPPTLPGALHRLHWRLHHGGRPLDIEVHDYAGEVYRSAFVSGSRDGEPGELVNRVLEASAVLLLINLQDIIDSPNGTRAVEDEWAPKAVLDFLAEHRNIRVSVVFTQTDQYLPELSAYGSWQAVYEEHLPQMAAIHPGVQVVPVSAVDEIVVREDPDTPGLAVPRPAPGFSSAGLDELLEWLVAGAEAAEETRKRNRNRSLKIAAAVVALLFTICLLVIQYASWRKEVEHKQNMDAVIAQVSVGMQGISTDGHDTYRELLRIFHESIRPPLTLEQAERVARLEERMTETAEGLSADTEKALARLDSNIDTLSRDWDRALLQQIDDEIDVWGKRLYFAADEERYLAVVELRDQVVFGHVLSAAEAKFREFEIDARYRTFQEAQELLPQWARVPAVHQVRFDRLRSQLVVENNWAMVPQKTKLTEVRIRIRDNSFTRDGDGSPPDPQTTIQGRVVSRSENAWRDSMTVSRTYSPGEEVSLKVTDVDVIEDDELSSVIFTVPNERKSGVQYSDSTTVRATMNHVEWELDTETTYEVYATERIKRQ